MEDAVGVSQPHCICIRMSTGSFVDYTSTSILHCGISNSNGLVFHFDETGYHRDHWEECVSVPLSGVSSIDSELRAWQASCEKQGLKFDYDTNRCLHYAVGLLNRVKFAGHLERPRSTVHIVCNPVVAGWRCMAAGWLHACNSAKLR
eukprot:COSAG01_NODE_33139_length_569_cov_2.293617_1_plen_146_part_01